MTKQQQCIEWILENYQAGDAVDHRAVAAVVGCSDSTARRAVLALASVRLLDRRVQQAPDDEMTLVPSSDVLPAWMQEDDEPLPTDTRHDRDESEAFYAAGYGVHPWTDGDELPTVAPLPSDVLPAWMMETYA